MHQKMNNILVLLLLTNCLILTYSTQSYKKVVPNINPDAKCIDGSPAALYQHIGSQNDKFIIFFGGGGSIGGQTLDETLQNTYQRSKTDLGSSNYMFQQIRPQGMMSTDPTKSKFATWNKFIFQYCDGSFHQGLRSTPISYKGVQLYLRGALNTRSHLKYIQQKYNFKNASQLLVAGVSAGGIASFMWVNEIRTMVNNFDAVTAIIDSGIFLNVTNIRSSQPKSSIMLSNMYKLANVNQASSFTDCNVYYPGKQYNCFFLQYSYTILKGRFMIVESLYDSYDLYYQYGVQCLVDGKQGKTFANCTDQQNKVIQSRRQQTLQLINQILVRKECGVWAIACSSHVYLGSTKFYTSENQTVQGFHDHTARQAVQQFILQRNSVIYVDQVKWPNNEKCAY